MREDRYRCLGLTSEQEEYIKRNIDKNTFAKTISIKHMYLCLEKNPELFKNCIVTKDDKVIVQKIIGANND